MDELRPREYTQVVHNNTDGRPWRAHAWENPFSDLQRDYFMVRDLFHGQLWSMVPHGTVLDEKTFTQAYEEVRRRITPRPDLYSMLEEVYLEDVAANRKRERTSQDLYGEVGSYLQSQIESRISQEKYTEKMLEAVYHASYRQFMELGRYDLISPLQTIYLGALVKLRTKTTVADRDIYDTLYGDPDVANFHFTADLGARDKEQSVLLSTARLPNVQKNTIKTDEPEKKVENLSEREQRYESARHDLEKAKNVLQNIVSLLSAIEHGQSDRLRSLQMSIEKRVPIANRYQEQADRILRDLDNPVSASFLALFETTVESIVTDITTLESLIPQAPADRDSSA